MNHGMAGALEDFCADLYVEGRCFRSTWRNASGRPWVRFLRAVDCPDSRNCLNRKDWEMVNRIFTSWNQLGGWLKQIDSPRRAA
jgi:hypothetical protein